MILFLQSLNEHFVWLFFGFLFALFSKDCLEKNYYLLYLTIIIVISIYQISGQQFSRVLIASRNSEYPWIFPVLRTERKMVRRFAKISEQEIKTSFFYPSDLVKLKQPSPSGFVKSVGYIPRRFVSQYIYSPLFTSPSGDSCILFAEVEAKRGGYLLSQKAARLISTTFTDTKVNNNKILILINKSMICVTLNLWTIYLLVSFRQVAKAIVS